MGAGPADLGRHLVAPARAEHRDVEAERFEHVKQERVVLEAVPAAAPLDELGHDRRKRVRRDNSSIWGCCSRRRNSPPWAVAPLQPCVSTQPLA